MYKETKTPKKLSPRRLALVLLALVLAPAASAFSAENFCHDPASWSDWEKLVQDNPFDQDLLGLYGLRVGLCALVERRTVTIDEATEIFERQRASVIKKKQVKLPKDAITL